MTASVRLTVVLEFDTQQDCQEWLDEHENGRCSDIYDWNTVRLASSHSNDWQLTQVKPRFPGLVTRPRRPGEVQIGTLTHGGPNQYRCGSCGGARTRGPSRCGDCAGWGWFAEGRGDVSQTSTGVDAEPHPDVMGPTAQTEAPDA